MSFFKNMHPHKKAITLFCAHCKGGEAFGFLNRTEMKKAAEGDGIPNAPWGQINRLVSGCENKACHLYPVRHRQAETWREAHARKLKEAEAVAGNPDEQPKN